MTLTLRIDNHDALPGGGPLSVTVTEAGVQVGRSSTMDWTLPDPDRHISSHHFDVICDGGAFLLVDTSTNGIFLEGFRHRLAAPHPLKHGDRFQVGRYYITVEFAGQAAAAVPQGAGQAAPQVHNADADPWAMPAAASPIDPNPRRAVDPFAGFSGDFIVNPGPPAAPQPYPPQMPAPSAPMPAQAPPAPHQPPASQAASGSPFTQSPRPIPAAPAPSSVAPVAPPPPAPVPQTSPQSGGGGPDHRALVAAFCEGAGLSADKVSDADALTLARELGRTMRVTAQELMAMLQDRATAKKFTRGGDRTMMGAEANNPLKFLPDAAEALEVMFLSPRAGFMTGGSGVDNALADVRLHQMAVFAAIQPALIKLLEDLAPEAIEDEAGGGLLGGGGKRKAWDTFVERWDAKAGGHDNGMLGAFLAHFADSYVAAVRAARK